MALTTIHGPLYGQSVEGAEEVLDEIVVTVTARLSDEDVHELPFTVNVIDGETLQERRLQTLEDALRSSPGVNVSSFGGFNDSNVRMRGVGSLFQINSEDSSVVLNVDGVPLPSRSSTLASMDIERVEILKGPQGTLFGRNSEAGAVNITTRRPTRNLEGYLRTEYGEEGQHLVEGAVGGPLSQTLSARIALRDTAADGVIHTAINGEPALRARDRGMRGSLLWQPGPATSVLMTTERQDQEGRAPIEVLLPYTEPPTHNVTPGVQYGTNVQDRHSIEITHHFTGSRFTSLTSQTHNDMETLGCQGEEFVSALFGIPSELCLFNESEYDARTQEFRLASLPGADLFWVAGVNAFRIRRRNDNEIPLLGAENDRWFQTDSRAAFGELSYSLTPELSITAGLRITREEKDYRAEFVSFGTSDQRTLADTYGTGRFALRYTIDEHLNIYGVVARGYKTGGFSDFTSQVADGEPLKAAVVDSLELGFKHSSPNRRFTLNGAMYLNQVKDDHLLGFDPNTIATQGLNTDTESWGAELEGTLQIGAGWTVASGVTFTDAEITGEVLGASGGDVQAGNKVPDVPRWGALARIEYSARLRGINWLATPELRALLSYRYLGSRPVDPQNHFDLDSNQKLDLRLMLLAGPIELSVWGDNLLDERNQLYGFFYAPGITSTVPSRGRTWGIGAAYYF